MTAKRHSIMRRAEIISGRRNMSTEQKIILLTQIMDDAICDAVMLRKEHEECMAKYKAHNKAHKAGFGGPAKRPDTSNARSSNEFLSVFRFIESLIYDIKQKERIMAEHSDLDAR